MKIYNKIIAAALFAAITLTTAVAQGAAKTPAPTTRPASKVVATVGDVSITSDKLQTAMQQMRTNSKDQALDQLITQHLIEAYVRSIPCKDDEIAAWKKEMEARLKTDGKGPLKKFMAEQDIPETEIPQMVRFDKINKQAMAAASADAVAAFTKANPSYFDGTQVQASHILLSCGAGASTENRAEVRKQLEQIAADIKADKIKFADAAKKHSKCPSSEKGGDLGDFAFPSMVTPFSQTAFGMKPGDVSGVVETQFGFHLIKVTKRTDGTGTAGPTAQQIAKRTLLSNFRDNVVAESRKSNPVTIVQ